MPRTYGKPKQTRLSFTPAAPPFQDLQHSPGDKSDRRAFVRYAHPYMPTVRHERSQVGNHKGLKQESPAPPAADAKSDEESLPKPGKSPKRKSGRKKGQSTQRSSSNEAVAVDNDRDSDLEILSSTKKNMGKRSLKRKRSAPSEDIEEPTSRNSPKPRTSEEDDDDDDDDDDDAEDIVARPRRKLRRRGQAPQPTIVLDDSEESEEDPVASSSAKNRRRNVGSEVPQTPRRGSNQDKLDLEEDLEDLQDSVVKETRTRGRFANSARAQRQQHLEALRRRRAGEKAADDTKSESEESQSESESEESEGESETNVRQPQFHNQTENSDVESAIASNEDLDRYDEDFVSDDGVGELGVPTGLEDMPFEFTRHAYKQTKDYFQDAVEWMVHNQLNPAFSRSSPQYKMAFIKLEDEVKGRTGSQLVSSAWNSKFHRALLARPHIEVTAFPTSHEHPCDACNRSGHPASSDIKLYGKAYSLETLEPLAEEDSVDEESESSVERDRDGNPLPDEDIRFYLGRHCKNKATMAHTLTHWRVHLNEWVVDYLDRMKYLEDERILERSHWSQKRKAKYAFEVVGTMVETGEVQRLWRDFHINLKAAREQTTRRW
ncbi:hypothetical protein ASPWEDRAFT_40514 [Aspergillus wentii DTO 134E9]|uniref:DUF4211 domain-containing protein n=1 Tax=Aspergillus wentii DTO 134E9 TaxID=1073089 RepID=A0A1L9RKD8_ASPWE|nr:uncharacterized protein ASPWEDRAFT_40514 [Aspergillus wentii DTO 134E9]KAI9923476.1 hypothetical protein MW887_008637 [Aspergillus wentii]OJJ35307.1 hypothetical protein ASPWEDRAFT_40514 [Aspergillus wentii DTO 134E9]